MAPITDREARQIEEANASDRPPVVFIHGLWLLPSSWNRWAELFGEAGFSTLTPGWPGDPEDVAEARADSKTLAGTGITDVADHVDGIIGALARRPAVIGHSFGGLLTEIIAGRGRATASVAIAPAPFRGVLPLPISALRAALPVLGNPANRKRAVTLTYEQFRFAFANAVSEGEAHELYDAYAVPAPGRPLFQAATANFDPRTAARVDVESADRGPMLLVYGEQDNTVPRAIVNASYKRQRRNHNVTEIAAMPNRGHALTIDSGWRGVADHALRFVARYT
jgi:pimeloyl-ACP methyl ester carboxylesterase